MGFGRIGCIGIRQIWSIKIVDLVGNWNWNNIWKPWGSDNWYICRIGISIEFVFLQNWQFRKIGSLGDMVENLKMLYDQNV